MRLVGLACVLSPVFAAVLAACSSGPITKSTGTGGDGTGGTTGSGGAPGVSVSTGSTSTGSGPASSSATGGVGRRLLGLGVDDPPL